MGTLSNLRDLLPHGGGAAIAAKLGISNSAVSQALKTAKPGNRVVQEALRMAKESGGFEAAQTLQALKAA